MIDLLAMLVCSTLASIGVWSHYAKKRFIDREIHVDFASYLFGVRKKRSAVSFTVLGVAVWGIMQMDASNLLNPVVIWSYAVTLMAPIDMLKMIGLSIGAGYGADTFNSGKPQGGR